MDQDAVFVSSVSLYLNCVPIRGSLVKVKDYYFLPYFVLVFISVVYTYNMLMFMYTV